MPYNKLFDINTLCGLVTQLALEHLEDRGQDHRDVRLEFRIESFSKCLNQRHERQLQEDVVPQVLEELEELEDLCRMVADMLLDDADQVHIISS